jgi:type III secretion protein U
MSGEKTEEPTHKKLEDLRKKGKVPKSKDAASTLSLVTMLFFVMATAWFFMALAMDMFTRCFEAIADPGSEVTPGMFALAGRALAWGILPVCAVALLMGTVGHVAQTGFLLSFEVFKPEMNKFNPAMNLKQMFSPDAFFEFGMGVLKVCVLGWIFYSLTMGAVPALITSLYAGQSAALPVLKVLIKQILYTFAVAFAVMAAADYLFRKFRFLKQNMMTKDEVKREYKDSEGDPHIKGRRKQLAEEAIEQAILEKTRQATVLVTNPTHYAVALYYDENAERLPVVMGKGEGRLALRMMKAAQEAGVPIMRDIPLARGLFAEGVIDHQIPVSFIKPVAETLKWARRFKRSGIL